MATMTRTRFYVGLLTSTGAPVNAEQRAEVERFVADTYGGGATVYESTGYWQGEREPSMVVECLYDARDAKLYPHPREVAGKVASIARQMSVLWTLDTVQAGFESAA